MTVRLRPSFPGAELDAATMAAVLARATGAELELSAVRATGAELELSDVGAPA
jgi:hypothetical protein